MISFSTPAPRYGLCVSSFAMDVVRAVSTKAFLWFFAEPMLEKLEHIKHEYGLT